MTSKPGLRNLALGIDGSWAYIYIWFSKKYRVVYIGETNSSNGTLGRAINHIQQDGTLRVRFREKTGLPLEKADDLILTSFRLPKKREFISIESSNRLAVEYLVQTKLHEVRGDLTPPFAIISRVTYTDLASKPLVKRMAGYITKENVLSFV